MSVADKKLRLKEYESVVNALRRLEDEKLEIIARGINTVGILSDMPKGTDISDRVGNVSVELEMIDEKIKLVKEKLKEVRQEMDYAIATLPTEIQKEVIFRRYILLWDFITIADYVHRDKRTVERIHGTALQKILL